MAKGQLTITQIARQLGLSTCTVSRAMNNTPNSGISKTTRHRVLEEVKRLGFQPNLSARALVTGKTHVIGAMIINSNNPFTGGFIYAMEEVAGNAGYHVLLCNTRGDIERERNEINMLRQRGVEGLIIEHLGPADVLLELAREDYPFVLLAPCPQAPELDYVTFNDVEGGQLATEALIQAGRRRIAHIAAPEGVLCAKDRLTGYHQALLQAGLSQDPDLVIRSRAYGNEEAGREAMDRLLDLSKPPDAVVCFDDYLAWGAYEAITRRGKKVPDDLAMVGCDDECFCSKMAVPLATIHLDMDRLGKEATRLLFEKIERGSKGLKGMERQAVRITPTLVRRASLGMERV